MRIEEKESKIILIILGLFLCITVLTLRLPHLKYRGFLSDEATYLAIAQSLVYDHDIYYEQKDLIRIVEKYSSGPQGIFLKRSPASDKLSYAKSIIYPLAATPFYAILEERGLLLFNIAYAFITLYFGIIWCSKLLRNTALATIVTLVFFFCTVCTSYLFWMTPEIFNFSSIFLGFIIWSYKYIDEGGLKENNSTVQRFMLSNYSNYVAALLFALATCSKPPNAILTIPLGIMLLKDKKWKEVFLSAIAFLLVVVIFFSCYYVLTGDWNFMGGERKTFYGQMPLDNPSVTFDNSGVSHSAKNYWEEYEINANIFSHNLFYFFLGRFSGIFLYFPCTLILLFSFCWNKKSLISLIAFIMIAVEILGYIILIPHNYFGGGGTLGNRYFMNIYPLFFLLIVPAISFRKVLVTVLYSAFFIGQMLINVFYFSFYPFAHSKYFPYTLFPPEMTMVENLPTNVNPHAFRIPFGNPPDYYIYFLNDNFYVPENGGFWVPGEKESEIIIETHRQHKKIIFQLENGLANKNKIIIRVSKQKGKAELVSGAKKDIEYDANIGYFHARNKWFYRVKIFSKRGYIPSFWQENFRDRRYLGCFVKIKFQ